MKRDGEGDNCSNGDSLSLPEDVVFDVLSRLPAKDLCRFRCVCKAWRALISDAAFVAAQRSRAGPIVVAMFGSEPEQQLRLLDKHGGVLRVFDVSGTASLAATRLDLVFVDRRQQLGAMIIDPASGRASTVVGGTNYPLPPPSARGWAAWTAVSDYSFGRAAPSGDYKVLRISISRCEVATVMDDGGGGGAAEPTWRHRPWGPVRFGPICPYERKATVNGVLYFMPSFDAERIRIVAFDLESEEWEAEMIKGPTLGRKEDAHQWSIALAELKGTLCVVHNVRHFTFFGDHYANIWLLKDPKRGIWVNEYTIQMPGSLLLSSMPLEVLGGDGTKLMLLNLFWKARNNGSYACYILQLYNSSTKAFTDFMEMEEGFHGRMAFYTGSLLS